MTGSLDRSLLARKSFAAGLAVLINLFFIVLKVTTGLAVGSLAILSDALDSVADLMAAAMAYFSVRFATRPADEGHPYGHGKMENISGTLEGLIIVVGALVILYQAVLRLLIGTTLVLVEWGIAVMVLVLALNLIMSRYILHVARGTDSVALEADGQHFRTNALQAIAVLGGLLLVRLTGLSLFDPLTALGMAILILHTGYQVLRQAFPALLDVRLPPEEAELVRAILHRYEEQGTTFHDLRGRRSGSQRHIDFHLVVAKGQTVEAAHGLCDEIEGEIRQRLPQTEVTIHVEPHDVDHRQGR